MKAKVLLFFAAVIVAIGVVGISGIAEPESAFYGSGRWFPPDGPAPSPVIDDPESLNLPRNPVHGGVHPSLDHFIRLAALPEHPEAITGIWHEEWAFLVFYSATTVPNDPRLFHYGPQMNDGKAIVLGAHKDLAGVVVHDHVDVGDVIYVVYGDGEAVPHKVELIDNASSNATDRGDGVYTTCNVTWQWQGQSMTPTQWDRLMKDLGDLVLLSCLTSDGGGYRVVVANEVDIADLAIKQIVESPVP